MPQYTVTGEKSHDVPTFILEQTTARKIILPSDYLEKMVGLRDLAVWIADPQPVASSEMKHDWDFCGTFLYLVEVYFDDEGFNTVYSGCSALQMIYNAATGEPLLKRCFDEPLGRNSSEHPVGKLEALGAMVGDDRKIECLYRTRYMTDEQCYLFDGEERRVNDLLGYPIYIAELI